VEIACLEITDHSECVESQENGFPCERDEPPYGDWAAEGLYAADSANVHLLDLNIHGLAVSGVHAGRLADWTVERVRIAANGWAGWDGDIGDDSSNSGTMVFRSWRVEWNGCGETYPGGEPVRCWAQSAGGYGDGVGTGATGGLWVIEDSAFLHNTSDGLDLLYARLTGARIEIRRTIAGGNAGNQIKTTGPAVMENVIAVGNCGFFEGQPFTACGLADATSRLIGDDMYVVKMTAGPGQPGGQPKWIGWRLEKFDAVTWKRTASVDVPLDFPTEQDGGPTISYINGRVVVTGEYLPDDKIESASGSGTHNHLFTADLESAGKIILKPPAYPPHSCETSMLQESGGDILMFASNGPEGDLIVLRFEKDWTFKEQRILRSDACFPTGSVTDGRSVYVAYTDISERGSAMDGQNVRIAAHDSEWNVLQDTAVADVENTPDFLVYADSPWVTMHDDFLYVSYLISELDPLSNAPVESQAFVNVYELIA
jgi:hypothetical protein